MKNVNKERLAFLLLLLGLVSVIAINTVRAQQPYSFPTTTQVPFYIQYAKVDGGLQSAANMINNAATTTTFVASQAGSTINITAGSAVDLTGTATLTLPVPVAGMSFDVNFLTSITAGTLAVKSDAATTFMAGGITIQTASGTGASSGNVFACNGTSHVQVKMTSTTAGGLIGGWLRFKALSATLWSITGTLVGSGTVVTPCST